MFKVCRLVFVFAILYTPVVFAASHENVGGNTVLVRAAQSARIAIGSEAKSHTVRFGKATTPADEMSSMGRLAHLASTGELDKLIRKARARALRNVGGIHALYDVPEECDEDDPDCEEGGDEDAEDGPAGGQAELSIAVDSSGMHIVVGTNDTRGFALNPLSVSGLAYSDDGGLTFVDGGQLPVNTGTVNLGGTLLPQVFGDPEVKYLGGSSFIYFSIMVKRFGATNFGVQTMCFHRSTDYGHTWDGPYEITPATNPTGRVNASGSPRDSADKEFADVDPETGRVMMTWSNFASGLASAPGGVEISSTYSDNVMAATPNWTTRAILGTTVQDGQASLPRFAKGSNDVYVAWRRSIGNNQNIGFARSTDNGATWLPTINTAPTNFFTMDQVLGNDRVNTSPSLAVDNSTSANHGNLYLVVSNNDNRDGADIAFQRSTDAGATWSAPILLNSRPGQDRPQWFPWITVDSDTGRVWVFYYDQGIATSGDLTETTYQYSDNGGLTWSKPAPLTDRPFHAGYGNDTGQPNLGDYNQAVAQNGQLFVVWAGAPVIVNYSDGQPTSSFSVPDIYFKRVFEGSSVKAPLSLAGVSFTDSGGDGFIDASETIALNINLRNYVTNGLIAGTVNAINGTLTSLTPNVLVTTANAAYGSAAANATVAQGSSYVLQIMPTFVAGTPIELALNVTSSAGPATLLHRLTTGAPLATPIFTQNFDGVAPGVLPAGWATIHASTNNNVPWTTNNTFMGSNAAFHQNANDGAGTGNTRFERLSTPSINVPAAAEYVLLDFDVKYNTEDEPLFNIWAYDGFLLRITDFTPGRFARANQVESFAEEFTTGNFQFYPKHMPRNSNTNYLQDLSAWAGDSGGVQHVHMKLPGMQGATVQMRFEYTQDSTAICTDVRPGTACGVAFDNVVMQSVVSRAGTVTSVVSAPNPSDPNIGGCCAPTFTATVTSGGSAVSAGTVRFAVSGFGTIGSAPVNAGGQAQLTFGLPAGTHSVTAYYSGTSTLAQSQGSTTHTVRAATSTSVAAARGQYSDVIALRATVTAESGLPAGFPALAGTVTFAIDGITVANSALAADGSAAANYTIVQAAGTYSLTARFTPSNNNAYAGSTSTAATLTVDREDVRVTASGGAFQVGAPGGTANFSLSAVLAETDSALGDLRRAAPITFTLIPVGPGPSFVVTGTPITVDPQSFASFVNVPPNVYDVTVTVGGDYYTGSGTSVVVVYDPSLGFLTGGGTVTHNGVKANFGFNFKFKKNGDAQGNFIFVEHRATGDVRVKSNALDPLSIAGNTGIVLGKATVSDVGGYSFRLVAVDNGEPGSSDQFGLQITDRNGASVPDLSFAPLTLNGGNIQVPHN